MVAQTHLGKYIILEELGRGGFGTVYRAKDSTLEREVALKVLHPQLTVDTGFLEKFRTEAKTVAALDSPNIVTVYDLGEADGRIFIAMKYMAGGSLKDLIEKVGALSFDTVQKIMQQVCSGLGEAHQKGLVHRDIKPANILFDGQGNAVISDFGLAKAVEMSTISVTSGAGGVGTPAYRAPELWEGKPPASPATDIYSLGCVLFEMLTGRLLFDGQTTGEIITQHLVRGPQLPADLGDGVPQGIAQILSQMLARDSHARFRSTKELLDALEGARQEKKQEHVPATTVSQPQPVPAKSEAHKITPPAVQPQVVKETADNRVLYGVLGGVIGIALLVWGLNAAKPAPVSAPAPTKTVAADRTPTPTQEPTSVVSPTPALGIGSSMQSDRDGMTLVYVPEGEFLMGSGENDADAWEIEKPQHSVYLDAYYIDQTEVSYAQYKLCVQAGACAQRRSEWYYNDGSYRDHPVVSVRWNDANDYCEWAGRELPTEAQWEKAARGTDGRIYPWGADIDCNHANYGACVGGTTPIGRFPEGASPDGELDTAGNVWEWVED